MPLQRDIYTPIFRSYVMAEAEQFRCPLIINVDDGCRSAAKHGYARPESHSLDLGSRPEFCTGRLTAGLHCAVHV